MRRSGPGAAVARAFLAACRLELDALKPGNVHRFAAGHSMTVEQFERSAEAAVAPVSQDEPGVGRRIFAAVDRTRQAAGCNTNLGILLLAGPLAEAFLTRLEGETLVDATGRVLTGLDREDARYVFAAIRLAAPGGLGRSGRHDVRCEPEVDLGTAMATAAHRDRIAWNYANRFPDIFRRGLPLARRLQAAGLTPEWACTGVYLDFLARIPDSHIRRKFGRSVANAVREEARELARRFAANEAPHALLAELLAFDRSLKDRGLNPGTSADLTVASFFALGLEAEIGRAD